MLVVDSRWWLRFPEADVDDRKLARDVRIGADVLGAMWMLHGFRVELAGSLRHGNRDDFDALFAELAAFTARVGVGHAHVAGVETALSLLDGRLADAERLALDALGSLHPDSWVALNTAAQIGSAWSWLGRDDELLNGLVGFATDRRSLQTFVDLWEIAIRARHGERDPRFDRFADDDFESLPRDQFRLAALAGAGAAAAGLRDEGSAVVLEAILQPYHGQFLILPHSLVAFDAADGLRGDLLTVLGRSRRGRRLPRGGRRVVRARAGCAPLDPDFTPARSGARVPRRHRRPRPSPRARRRRARACHRARHAQRGQGRSGRARTCLIHAVRDTGCRVKRRLVVAFESSALGSASAICTVLSRDTRFLERRSRTAGGGSAETTDNSRCVAHRRRANFLLSTALRSVGLLIRRPEVRILPGALPGTSCEDGDAA